MDTRTFHSQDGLYFTRNPDGSVTITKTDGKPADQGGKIHFTQTLDDGSWCSAVLSMTAHGERSGDWPQYIEHHNGHVDLLTPMQGISEEANS